MVNKDVSGVAGVIEGGGAAQDQDAADPAGSRVE